MEWIPVSADLGEAFDILRGAPCASAPRSAPRVGCRQARRDRCRCSLNFFFLKKIFFHANVIPTPCFFLFFFFFFLKKKKRFFCARVRTRHDNGFRFIPRLRRRHRRRPLCRRRDRDAPRETRPAGPGDPGPLRERYGLDPCAHAGRCPSTAWLRHVERIRSLRAHPQSNRRRFITPTKSWKCQSNLRTVSMASTRLAEP